MEQNPVGNSDTASEIPTTLRKCNNSGSAAMSDAAALIQDIAGPARGQRDSVKAMLRRAHEDLVKHGFTWNRLRDLWHGDKRLRLSPGEIDILRRAAARDQHDDRHDQSRIDTLALELAELEIRIAQARQTLAPGAPARPFRMAQTQGAAALVAGDEIARPEVS